MERDRTVKKVHLIAPKQKTTFKIGESIIKIESFTKTERHEDALRKRGELYVQERDNPGMTRRPGSLDAFKMPSIFLGQRVAPKHHVTN